MYKIKIIKCRYVSEIRSRDYYIDIDKQVIMNFRLFVEIYSFVTKLVTH